MTTVRKWYLTSMIFNKFFQKKKQEAKKAERPQEKKLQKTEEGPVKKEPVIRTVPAKTGARANILPAKTGARAGAGAGAHILPAKTGAGADILLYPHATEKATQVSEIGQYIFKVSSFSNKPEIKKAVESLYRVNVVSVKIINVPGKERRRGKAKGWTKSYKKAIVKVGKGQKIDVSA